MKVYILYIIYKVYILFIIYKVYILFIYKFQADNNLKTSARAY